MWIDATPFHECCVENNNSHQFGTAWPGLLIFCFLNATGCSYLVLFSGDRMPLAPLFFCFYSHRMPLAPHVFLSTHTGCLWLLMFLFLLTQDAFGSSCFCFDSHNRMPLAPHVFVSSHTTGCLWLLMFLFLLTQDALGSSQNRMPLAPHVFVSTHRTGCPWLLTEQDAFGSSCSCVGAVSTCLLLQ